MSEQQPAALHVEPEQRERLTLDGLDAIEAITAGEWSIADARALVGDDALVHGLILYTQMLEVMVMLRGALPTVEPVREAARVNARAWRKAAS